MLFRENKPGQQTGWFPAPVRMRWQIMSTFPAWSPQPVTHNETHLSQPTLQLRYVVTGAEYFVSL